MFYSKTFKIICAFIILIGININLANATAMGGYEEGKIEINIILKNSKGNNQVNAWSENYNEEANEKIKEKIKESLKINIIKIDDNKYQYKNNINMMIVHSPYIEITRNNGEIDSFYNFNMEALENQIPVEIIYDCETGSFIDNTNYELKSNTNNRNKIFIIIGIAIIVILAIVAIIIIKRKGMK